MRHLGRKDTGNLSGPTADAWNPLGQRRQRRGGGNFHGDFRGDLIIGDEKSGTIPT